jgi:2-polyprenyl-3-methyl-5-hydroxy-6-metoxy-1,4-benzoquinol methylase
MNDTPVFRKYDRYKASSYHAYNYNMPTSYDSCIWHKICQSDRCDLAVINELSEEVTSLQILDVGCATGRLLLKLAEAGAAQLSGVDLAPRIIDIAREKLSARHIEADLQAADVEDVLPWPTGSFDIVTLTGVLHHLYRPYEALEEINRVLRVGGRLILVDPSFVPVLRHIFNLALKLAPHAGDYHFYTQGGAVRLLDNEGWTQTRARSVGWALYLISTQKYTELNSLGR